MDKSGMDYCRNVRDSLMDYYRGEMYECPNCGERVNIKDGFDDEEFICMKCCGSIEETSSVADYRLGVYDYFRDALDLMYYITSEREYAGVRIMVAFGGPTVYVDTRRGEVELYWWNEHESVHLDREICDELDELYEQVWN